MKARNAVNLSAGLTISVILASVLPVYGASEAAFYQGKTITIIQDSTPGGIGELRTRSLMPVLPKHIPGNPNIVIEFMPGGGGRKAANHLFNVARPDGLTIARVSSGLVESAILGLPGVKYDIEKFIYLGSGHHQSNQVFFSRKDAGLDSLEKLRVVSGVRVAGQSVGHSNYVVARLFAWLLDLKEPRFVTGFSGAEIDLALRRGEVDARANAAESIVQRTPDFIEKGLVHFHGLTEIPYGFRYGHPAFAKLPALHSFARTEGERKVLALFGAFLQFSQAFILPPGTPKDRADILKEAFRKSWRDPEFLQNWKKLTVSDASPLMPEQIEKLVRDIPRDPQHIELLKKIAGPDPLPRR